MQKGLIMVGSIAAIGSAWYFSRQLRSQYQVGHDSPDMPIGIRNNNPTNILWDGVTKWQGMVGVDKAQHVIFDTPQNGIRAAARILKTKAGHGIDNVVDLCKSWTGVDDKGNEDTYASVSGYEPHQSIDLRSPAVQARVIPAIVRVENGFGKWYLNSTYSSGIASA